MDVSNQMTHTGGISGIALQQLFLYLAEPQSASKNILSLELRQFLVKRIAQCDIFEAHDSMPAALGRVF